MFIQYYFKLSLNITNKFNLKSSALVPLIANSHQHRGLWRISDKYNFFREMCCPNASAKFRDEKRKISRRPNAALVCLKTEVSTGHDILQYFDSVLPLHLQPIIFFTEILPINNKSTNVYSSSGPLPVA